MQQQQTSNMQPSGAHGLQPGGAQLGGVHGLQPGGLKAYQV
ncbi:hypothetical protein HaLaN_05339 [Haematococcus lacustris]|uniref:Uncharacterized protein n=1 Tax=Haematococcus lacustris TaxID=44745 RepID=A0A699YQP5_HAELA|nr:hypothetical protein HaLaN_05339 [Haematococcus lacustris]